jgi:hypothetical protein
MSKQQTNSEIVSETRSKANTTAALKRLVRRNLPRKRDRQEAIKRAATVKFETPEQRFKRKEPVLFAGMRDAPLKVGKA